MIEAFHLQSMQAVFFGECMEWYKRYTNRSNHGQMYEAGFWGGVVFDALCDSSAAYDLNGRLPKVYGEIDYLRRQLRLSEADFCGECKPSRNVTDAKNNVVTHENHVVTVLFNALKRLISVGLVHEEDDFYVIDGWERKQRKPPKSDAERSRNYREKIKTAKSTEESITVTKRHVHESDANVRVTERHDKRREEKSRVDKNRQEQKIVADATSEKSAHRSITEKMVQAYEQARNSKYLHQKEKDGAALKDLLSIATEEEILARWVRGLQATGWHQVSTFAQLRQKWNDLAQPQPANQHLTTSRPKPLSTAEALELSRKNAVPYRPLKERNPQLWAQNEKRLALQREEEEKKEERRKSYQQMQLENQKELLAKVEAEWESDFSKGEQ